MRPLSRAFFLLTAILLNSCSLVKSILPRNESIVENSEIQGDLAKDYADHLSALSESILNTEGIKVINLSKRNKEYLSEIFKRVQANNELLLPKGDPSFYLIRDKTPYIFSLPGYKFFISKGLIRKYFKNESLLISALTFEIIRSGREIYPKRRVIPLGYITIPQVLSITRIGIKNKIALYEWTYFALKRAEFDGTAILNWIQTQNKNTLDFSWQIRDPRGVTREEFLFKNFLVSQGVNQGDFPEKNSSTGFYYFQDTIR